MAWVRSYTTGADRPLPQNPMFLGSAGDLTIFQILTRRSIDISPFSAVRRAVRLVAHACVLLGVLPKDASGLTSIVRGRRRCARAHLVTRMLVPISRFTCR